MSEHIRALIVIAFITAFMFVIAGPALSRLLSKNDFERLRNLWIGVTLIVFLSHNFWIYIFATALLILAVQHRVDNKIQLYLMLLFAVPPVSSNISGFGVMEQLFELNHTRLLELVILLPAYAVMVRKKQGQSFLSNTPDKLLFAYLLYTVLLQLRETTITDTLRFGFYNFIDVFLPYFVVSRALRNFTQFRLAISALVFSCLLLAALAFFEYMKHWLLYRSLTSALDARIAMTGYLMRGESLRALGTTGQPIVLGYVMMIALAFLYLIRNQITSAVMRYFLFAVMGAGLFASISRGPWVGTLLFFVILAMLGFRPVEGVAKMLAGGVMAIVLLLTVPAGDKLINLLPFVGTVDAYNVDYRQRLMEEGLIVFQRQPIFGSVTYLNTPEMQSMRQGQGIIDVVNTYLGIALEYGLIGLLLFAGVFLSILWGLFRILRRFKVRKGDEYFLGATLFAVTISILFTIYTVSSITLIPTLYWVIAGMGVAYIQLFSPRTYNGAR